MAFSSAFFIMLFRDFVIVAFPGYLSYLFVIAKRTDLRRHKPAHLLRRRVPNAVFITKTCLYIFDPLKPHFYIVKLGFTGYTLFFLISAQNIDCGYSLQLPW